MAFRRLVVVATEEPLRAQSALADLEATAWETRSPVPGQYLVYGSYVTEAASRAAATSLRAGGWAATERPADDDPALYGWHNRTRPLRVAGGRLRVCFPWAEEDRDAATEIQIDPGGAFGSGTHPTTHLLLEALAAHLRGGERVLDIGCGSGVLAIAAVHLGAAFSCGVDVDPAAVRATRANATRNGMGDRVSATAAPLTSLAGSFDVIVANIGRDILIELADDVQRRLAPNGWLGLSGISPAQVSTLAKAYDASRVIATPALDDWCAIIAASKTG